MRFCFLFITLFLVNLSAYGQPASEQAWTANEALLRFAGDYENDPSAISPISFGIEVDTERYLVRTIEVDGVLEAHVSEGFGTEPTFFFSTDRQTLAKIDAGALHGLTAMAQTRADDPAPMTLEFMEGFVPANQSSFQSTFLSIAFHFWTRETPEVVKLDESASRIVHGANAIAIFYDPELHSAWYHVKRGQHVNAEPKDQTNAHPSLFVFTKGIGNSRIDGTEHIVSAGDAIHVPAGTPHEFWNSNDLPLEFIILMWGFDN
ncbi:MAG: cupin domain-containing protein [Pseudomonadota bacterium]